LDNIVPSLYKEYGQFINSSRAFPLVIDGLKPVERRILLSAYKIARDHLVKSARVDGYVIGNYHPHASVYSSIVQLVRQGFLEGQGNFGCNLGVESEPAAASRYTECKLAKSTYDLSFKYIDYVEWYRNELGEEEPSYLPTMFPLCLMGNDFTQGIGFGYRSYIPCYKIEDLYRRLLWLLKIEDKKPTISPITDCKIEASKSDLETLLTKGKATIDISGIIKKDPQHNIVDLLSWQPGRRFENILNRFSDEITRQDIAYTDLSVTNTKIQFEVIKQRNRDKIYMDFVEKLEDTIKGKISFENIVVDGNQNVRLVSIDDMLITTFNSFSSVCNNMLKTEFDRLQNQMVEIQNLKKIQPYLLQILSQKMEPNMMIKEISKKSGVDESSVKELIGKHKIRKLITLNVDLSDLENKIKVVDNNLHNLGNFVLEEYKEILK
jgi:hypothetical protein